MASASFCTVDAKKKKKEVVEEKPVVDRTELEKAIAAAEALKAEDYTPESFDKFVEAMVAAKEKAGQFAQAEITIHEMNVVKATLKKHLQELKKQENIF